MQDTNNAKFEMNTRVGLLLGVFMLVGFAILAKILYLQYSDNENERAIESGYLLYQSIKSERGNILDTHGKLLVTSIKTYNIYMDLAVTPLTDKIFNRDIDSLCIGLASILNTDTLNTADFFKNKLLKAREKKNRFLEIALNVPFDKYNKLRKLPIFRRGQFKGGFIASQITSREYPFNSLMARTLGTYVKDEITNQYVGKIGLEENYEHILGGIPGTGWAIKLPKKAIMPIDVNYKTLPIDGKDIVTAIDIDIQDFATRALRKQLKYLDAEYGVAVLMEVKTGNIIAMVNLEEDRSDSTNIRYTEQYNYAVGGNIEPGSTFKLPILIAAFEKDPTMKLTDIIDIERGYKKYGSFEFRDSYFFGSSKKTILDIFRHSSNVGMSKVTARAFGNDYDSFIKHLYSFGITKKTGIDIQGEKRPFVKPKTHSQWSSITMLQMSIGYEVEVSPVQLLTLYNAVANNGVEMKPRLVRAYKKEGQPEEPIKPVVINNSICTEATLKKVQQALLAVVDSGTARSIRSSRYKIAGKTGTTKYFKVGEGYSGEYRGSFVGYFPADKPKYSCIVVINRPKGSYYGSKVAAPVFKKIADKLYSIDPDMNTQVAENKCDNREAPVSKSGHKIDTDIVLSMIHFNSQNAEKITSPWVKTKKLTHTVSYSNYTISNKFVPSVRGLGAKDAVFLLESIGLKTKIKGRGEVRQQSLPEGRKFKKGDVITLKLY